VGTKTDLNIPTVKDKKIKKTLKPRYCEEDVHKPSFCYFVLLLITKDQEEMTASTSNIE
jgi:hypothetical protein